MTNLNNLILWETNITVYIQVLINVTASGEFDYRGEGESWYSMCIVLISLHWQPMWIIIIIIIIHVTRELQLPASTKGFMWGGRGDLYSVYRRIYGELLLIFVLYFNCHSNQKWIFKGAFFLPPPQIVFESSISGIFIWSFFFFFCFTQLSSCVFSYTPDQYDALLLHAL